MKKPWVATKVRTLLTNPHFSVLYHDVVVPDGSKREYYTVNFPTAAVGVIARRGKDILLVKQYRFIVDEFVWALPSGGVAEGETAESAAARELEEETGYRAGTLAPLMHCYASYGCSNQRFEIFITDNVIETAHPVDGNEVIAIRWFTQAEILELLFKNGIVDNLSLSPLLLLLLREQLERSA